ncbi:tetratricopeptide repeat protein [Pseudothauera hydrothermalis]|uniref:tetratricopeptide repeat protein n=1 Tax=Pseudothauera hydrothermalis TaxID=2184083 RepID=UPI001315AC6F|nr:tetratricopeptide repeat protein [Pseudothauera hydrothermalis]
MPAIQALTVLLDARSEMDLEHLGKQAALLAEPGVEFILCGKTYFSSYPASISDALADGRCRIVAASSGKIDAINEAIAQSPGRWITIVDAQGMFKPDHLRSLRAIAARSPEFAAIYADVDLSSVSVEARTQLAGPGGYWKRRLSAAPPRWLGTWIFAPGVFERGARFDSRFEHFAKWDFVLQCAEFGDFLHVARQGACLQSAPTYRAAPTAAAELALLTEKWGAHYAKLAEQADAVLYVAKDLHAKGQYAEAQARAAAGLAIDPGNPGLLSVVASCRMKANDGPGALAALRRANESDPWSFSLLADRCMLETRFGNLGFSRKALDLLERMAQSDEDRAKLGALRRQYSTAVSDAYPRAGQ